MSDKIVTLEEAVKSTLGGVAAISEEGYIDAVNDICEMCGRDPEDGKIWDEIGDILRTLPCPID